MLKTDTLKKNYEFRNILKKGKYYRGEVIDIYIKNNSNVNINYIGIAVGVKIAKACKRNRIKRLIRENYRLIEKDLNTGFCIVFICKKNINIDKFNFLNIKNDMRKILIKAEVINVKKSNN